MLLIRIKARLSRRLSSIIRRKHYFSFHLQNVNFGHVRSSHYETSWIYFSLYQSMFLKRGILDWTVARSSKKRTDDLSQDFFLLAEFCRSPSDMCIKMDGTRIFKSKCVHQDKTKKEKPLHIFWDWNSIGVAQLHRSLGQEKYLRSKSFLYAHHWSVPNMQSVSLTARFNFNLLQSMQQNLIQHWSIDHQSNFSASFTNYLSFCF